VAVVVFFKEAGLANPFLGTIIIKSVSRPGRQAALARLTLYDLLSKASY
jgi:hypothetical protein